MPGPVSSSPHICSRCLRVRSILSPPAAKRLHRQLSTTSPHPHQAVQDGGKNAQLGERDQKKEEGAMSRRLSQMTEENLETGGRGAKKAVEEAGFNDDLKRQLEERIANASFKSEHASAFAQANLPASAVKETRDIAGAQAWTGTESVADASLRMLNDAYKPIKVPFRPPPIRGPPNKIDTGRSRDKASSGSRIANARDKTSVYSYLKDPSLSDKQKEEFRKQLKERFAPAARSVPATLQGLASLANERIEDAIARGQFKNLPRGQVIERDYNASSPFLDTTEYFMNKIIQRQDIVPPWIEKQQELVSTASKFRSRLRADWRRHVARSIGSRGGSLESQIRLAEEYARAEAIENPPKDKVEKLNAVDDDGQVSQITLADELKPANASSETTLPSQITVTEQSLETPITSQTPEQQIVISAVDTPITTNAPPQPQAPPALSVMPFRDSEWLDTERSYFTLAIENLNNITRSYNLMAPNLAKKPYFNLERELRSCYADVAPLVSNEIRERARAPKLKVEVIGHRPGGVMERFGSSKVKVYDDRKPKYGFREFWRDLFRKEGE